MNLMNNQQIAFIICVNEDWYAQECIWYIQQLEIPEGYSIDVITISEAKSMAEGYNAAMQASDAKYKVYLHQDTFIINTHFIADVLRTFQISPSIGMIGMVGDVALNVTDGQAEPWKVGSLYTNEGNQTIELRFRQPQLHSAGRVQAIDGALLVTQQDIPWREDLQLDWNNTSISQSLEFGRNHLSVVVPYQEYPWCVHCSRHGCFHNNYHISEALIKEYGEIFDFNRVPVDTQQQQRELYQIAQRAERFLIQSIDADRLSDAKALLEEMYNQFDFYYPIIVIKHILDLDTSEQSHTKFIQKGMRWEEIYKKYIHLQFLAFRQVYLKHGESREQLCACLQKGELSQEAMDLICRVAKIEPHFVTRLRDCLLQKYAGVQDEEIQNLVNYIKKYNTVEVFNDEFAQQYKNRQQNLYFDEETQSYYVMYQNKKMYLRKGTTEAEGISYINGLEMEQDEKSPHRYIEGDFDVQENDIVIDAGVAEGNFALSVIDKVQQIYLVECDEEWVEALNHTFAAYQDKVTIIPKMLGNSVDETHTTIDEITGGQPVQFIKMDIEGAEVEALEGGSTTLNRSTNCRCAICAYHRSDAQTEITEILEHAGYKTKATKGYMVYNDTLEFMANPEFRRGIIRGCKG